MASRLAHVSCLLASLLCVGCADRSEYYRARELSLAGDHKGAYHEYWRAYRKEPRLDYRAELEAAGRVVAAAEHARGLALEQARDLDGALEAFALALEYDRRSFRIREDHARVWGLVHQWEDRTEELDRLRKSGGPWFLEAEILEELLAHPLFTSVEMEALAELRIRRLDDMAAPLREATFHQPLPGDPDLLDALTAGWTRLTDECRRCTERDDRDLASLEPAVRELAAAGRARPQLDLLRGDALQALDILSRAKDGLRALAEASRLEEESDLLGALDAYLRASVLHPDLDRAVRGMARTRRRFIEEEFRDAHLEVRSRDWRSALDHLDRLLGIAPDLVEARELRDVATRELVDRLALEARRFEETGLQGNALVRFLQVLELEPWNEPARQGARRNEDSILGRLRQTVIIMARSESDDERRSRRELWQVGDEVLTQVDGDIQESAQSMVDRLTLHPCTPAPMHVSAAGALPLWIDDTVLSVSREDSHPGWESGRYVESLQWVPNPDLPAARARSQAARDRHEELLAELATGAPQVARELEPLVRLERLQAEAIVASMPERIVEIGWAEAYRPKKDVRVRAELAARYRLMGERREISVSMDETDTIVDGDPARGVPPDPPDAMTRAEVLRALAPRLGVAMAEEAVRALERRRERLYREALEYLDAHSYDLAIENLVAFVLARRGSDDPALGDAVARIRALTGWTFGQETR